jgi:hypothetical protein
MVAGRFRVVLATALACSSAALFACGSDSESGSNGGGASGSGASNAGTGGAPGTGGVACSTPSSGGTSGSANGGGGASGGSGGASGSGGADSHGGADSNGGVGGSATDGCIEGIEGTWKIPGYEAYLRIDDACWVTLFCDLVKGYHSTGYFEGDTITLIDVATADVTLEGDTLTLLIPSETTDTIIFERQASEDVIPEACLE